MKNFVFIFSIIAVALVATAIAYFYTPQVSGKSISNNPQTTSSETENLLTSNKVVSKTQTSNIANNRDVLSKSTNPSIGDDFITRIQNIITGTDSRVIKLETFKSMFNNAKNEDEKIAALQSMAFLKPIEHTDFLVMVAHNPQETERVRGEALRALNNAYLIDENLVKEIGGSNVYIGTRKISQYMDEIVSDPKSPPQLYEIALSSYSYTNHEKAIPLAKNFLNSGEKLDAAKSGFVTNVAFSDKDNMKDFIPTLLANPSSVTDQMAVKISTIASDPIIQNELDNEQKKQIIEILQNHNFDKTDSNYQINIDTVNFNLKSIHS